MPPFILYRSVSFLSLSRRSLFYFSRGADPAPHWHRSLPLLAQVSPLTGAGPFRKSRPAPQNHPICGWEDGRETSQTTAGNQRETAPVDGNQSTDRRPTYHRPTYHRATDHRATYRRAINERQRSRSATSCFRSSSREAKRCSARMRSRNSTQISRP